MSKNLYLGTFENPIRCLDLNSKSIQFCGLHENISRPLEGGYKYKQVKQFNLAASEKNIRQICRLIGYSLQTSEVISSQFNNAELDIIKNRYEIDNSVKQSLMTISCIEPGK